MDNLWLFSLLVVWVFCIHKAIHIERYIFIEKKYKILLLIKKNREKILEKKKVEFLRVVPLFKQHNSRRRKPNKTRNFGYLQQFGIEFSVFLERDQLQLPSLTQVRKDNKQPLKKLYLFLLENFNIFRGFWVSFFVSQLHSSKAMTFVLLMKMQRHQSNWIAGKHSFRFIISLHLEES